MLFTSKANSASFFHATCFNVINTITSLLKPIQICTKLFIGICLVVTECHAMTYICRFSPRHRSLVWRPKYRDTNELHSVQVLDLIRQAELLREGQEQPHTAPCNLAENRVEIYGQRFEEK